MDWECWEETPAQELKERAAWKNIAGSCLQISRQSISWKTFIITLVWLVKDRVMASTRPFQKQRCSPGGLGKQEAPWHNTHQPRLLCLLVIHCWQLLGRNPLRTCSDALQHPLPGPLHTPSPWGFLWSHALAGNMGMKLNQSWALEKRLGCQAHGAGRQLGKTIVK